MRCNVAEINSSGVRGALSNGGGFRLHDSGFACNHLCHRELLMRPSGTHYFRNDSESDISNEVRHKVSVGTNYVVALGFNPGNKVG